MNSPRNRPSRFFCLAALLALYTALRITRLAEWPRFLNARQTGGGLSWLFNWNTDSTPFALLLFLLPVAWYWRTGWKRTVEFLFAEEKGLAQVRPWLPAAIVGLAALAGYVTIAERSLGEGVKGRRFGDLPPAFHDEYSYLFQTHTFLTGRARVEPPAHAELFNQMHVLNEGYMASRYFPAVGAWLAPFVAVGHAYWAQWTAGVLSAVFVFLAARELGGNFCGLCAGLLIAISPGVRLFGNLLLAHHPTLLGLTGFLYCYLRFMKSRSVRWGFLAGCGLSFAMLCRPMSAAGFALPM